MNLGGRGCSRAEAAVATQRPPRVPHAACAQPIGFCIGALVGLVNPLLVGYRGDEYMSLQHEWNSADDMHDGGGGDGSDGADWAPPARAVQWAS